MTGATLIVLKALIDDPSRERYGLELARATELATGTLHPILARFEAARWLESRWEELGQEAIGRPRRRFYRLTPDGVVRAARALDRHGARMPGTARLRPGLADGVT